MRFRCAVAPRFSVPASSFPLPSFSSTEQNKKGGRKTKKFISEHANFPEVSPKEQKSDGRQEAVMGTRHTAVAVAAACLAGASVMRVRWRFCCYVLVLCPPPRLLRTCVRVYVRAAPSTSPRLSSAQAGC